MFRNPISDVNQITKFFYSINKFSYVFGLPNFVRDDNNLPKIIVRYNSIYVKTVNFLLSVFVAAENVSFITQKNLTAKQRSDLLTLGCSHFLLCFYYISLYQNRIAVREIAHSLTVSLKNVYNDTDIEKAAISKSKLYMFLFLTLCSGALFSYGLEALFLVITGDGKFITVITAWPDVDDDSVQGNIWRVIFYILWWFFMLRVMALFLVVITSTINLSYQYQNVQSYFYNLAKIFDEDLSQVEKEVKYERAIKTGIQLHMDTLRCTKYSQKSFNVIFCVQIVINTMTLVLVLIRLVTSEHTLMNLLASGVMGTAILTGTGLFMWNLGDVTIEASKVPMSMYCSGWENCTARSSVRVRQLICFAMTQGQEKVSIRALGIIELSYTSYVTLVKSAYSVFSVFY